LVVVLEDKFILKSASLKWDHISLPGRLKADIFIWCRNEIFMLAQVPESKSVNYHTKFLIAPAIILPASGQVSLRIARLPQMQT